MIQDTNNPFHFEKNHKKFIHKLEGERHQIANQEEQEEVKKQQHYERLYQQSINFSKYGIIRAFNEEAQKMAKERDEMFLRDQALDPVMKRVRHFSLALLKDVREAKHPETTKNYRVKNILKERETIAEYVNKKRQIFLSNMNISIKKDETNRLEDFIKNEQESLKARQLYFKNDCELVRKFMDEVKIQADKATDKADAEAKRKEIQKEEISQLNTLNERLRIQRTKLKEEFERLSQYKDFIEKLQQNYQSIFEEVQQKQHPNQRIRHSERSKVFVTDMEAGKVQEEFENMQHEEEQQRMAELLIEILNHIQEKNLQYIQNQHDSEEELESRKREARQLQEALQKQQRENAERLRTVQKQIEHAWKKRVVLEQLNKHGSNTLQFEEGENLDMDRIGKLIIDIQRDCTKDPQKINAHNELEIKEVYKAMAEIESMVFKLLNLRRDIIRNPKHKSEFFDPLDRRLKQQEKRARLMRTQNDDKLKQLQDKIQKKEEYLKQFYKGRKPMYRWFVEKKSGKKKVVLEVKVDDDEKYFEENFELGSEQSIVM